MDICFSLFGYLSYQVSTVPLKLNNKLFWLGLGLKDLKWLRKKLGWGGVGVVGLAENKANSAQLELELGLGLSLAIFKNRK